MHWQTLKGLIKGAFKTLITHKLSFFTLSLFAIHSKFENYGMKQKKLFSKYGCGRRSLYIKGEVGRVRVAAHRGTCSKKEMLKKWWNQNFLQLICNYLSRTPTSTHIHSLIDVFLFLFAVIIVIRAGIIKEHQKLAEGDPVFRLGYQRLMKYIEEKVELHKKMDTEKMSPGDIFWLYLVPPVSLC